MTTTVDASREQLQRLAEEGRRAGEALAAADQRGLERRTAELAAEQEAYDLDLCRRAPELDAELARQRREATTDLQAAVDATDLERALSAWRREASARFAQRDLRDAWAGAHQRCGLGTAPAEPSLHQADEDTRLSFLASLDRAADASARIDAEVEAARLVGDRPSALASDVLPGPEATLAHAPSCPDPARTEVASVPAGSRSTGTTIRCLACSASRALYVPPPEPEELAAAQRGKALPDVRVPGQHDRPGQGG